MPGIITTSTCQESPLAFTLKPPGSSLPCPCPPIYRFGTASSPCQSDIEEDLLWLSQVCCQAWKIICGCFCLSSWRSIWILHARALQCLPLNLNLHSSKIVTGPIPVTIIYTTWSHSWWFWDTSPCSHGRRWPFLLLKPSRTLAASNAGHFTERRRGGKLQNPMPWLPWRPPKLAPGRNSHKSSFGCTANRPNASRSQI